MAKMIFSLLPKATFRVSLSERLVEHFDRTDESDYIYLDDTIIYYIGSSTRPEVPEKLDGVTVRVIERTAFNGNTNVEAVKLPIRMEVIE